jgi:hypothetical protein
MANKIIFIKAMKDLEVQTMDIPISEIALAIDVCYNLQGKKDCLTESGFTITDIVYGYPVFCSWCNCIIGAAEIEHSHGICVECVKKEMEDYQEYASSIASLSKGSVY